METRRCLPNEGGYGLHARVLLQHTRQRVSHQRRLLYRRPFAQVYLHGEALALRLRQQLYVQPREQEETEPQGEYQQQIDRPRAAEAVAQHLLIATLQPAEELVLPALEAVHLFGARAADKARCHIGRYPCGVEDTCHEGEHHGEGEELDELAQGSRDNLGHGEEHAGDRAGGERHGDEELLRADRGGVPAAVPFLQEIGVAVDDYHRIVHYHAQHEDECRKRYGVQFNAHQIHQPQRNRDTYGYARACHEGCAQREEHEHDKDDDHDRDEYVAQERGDRGIHHLRLVGDTMELQVGR